MKWCSISHYSKLRFRENKISTLLLRHNWVHSLLWLFSVSAAALWSELVYCFQKCKSGALGRQELMTCLCSHHTLTTQSNNLQIDVVWCWQPRTDKTDHTSVLTDRSHTTDNTIAITHPDDCNSNSSLFWYKTNCIFAINTPVVYCELQMMLLHSHIGQKLQNHFVLKRHEKQQRPSMDSQVLQVHTYTAYDVNHQVTSIIRLFLNTADKILACLSWRNRVVITESIQRHKAEQTGTSSVSTLHFQRLSHTQV